MLFSEQGKHAWYSRLCQNNLVCNAILLGNVQNPSETLYMEGIESVFLVGVRLHAFLPQSRVLITQALYTLILVLMDSMEVSQTHFC